MRTIAKQITLNLLGHSDFLEGKQRAACNPVGLQNLRDCSKERLDQGAG
jgi:hypothetical protein